MLHRGQLYDGLLQGFQLNPNPTHFHLPIHSTMVVDPTQFIARSQISRVVDTANALQLDEFGLGLLFFFKVAPSQTNPSHEQNTSLAIGLDVKCVRVQDVASVGGQFSANRNDVTWIHISTCADH